MKKIIIGLFAGLLVSTIAFAEEPEEYTAGDFEYILLDDGTAEITRFSNDTVEELEIPEQLDGNPVTSLGFSSIVMKDELKSIEFPETMKIIKAFAVSNCDNLTSLVFNEGLEIIEGRAFTSCANLSKVILPGSITNISGNPFVGCENLSFDMPSDHAYLAVIDGALFSKPDKRLIYCPDINKQYIVPEGVESIGDSAMVSCNKLEEIVLPDSVTQIGELAFSSCDGLTELVLPEKLLTIGSGAFAWCTGLDEVKLPDSLIEIDDNAFLGCEGLTSILLPEHIDNIPGNPFVSCSNLTFNVSPDHEYLAVIDGVLFSKPDKRLICCPNDRNKYDVPEGIQCVGNLAFQYCDNLTSVSLPNSVTEIGDYAFQTCDNLTEVLLPEGLEKIGDYAFYLCDSLTELVLPDGLETIGASAFSGCYNLRSINLPETISHIGDEAFLFLDDLTITVERDSYAAEYCKDNELNYTYPDANDWLNG